MRIICRNNQGIDAIIRAVVDKRVVDDLVTTLKFLAWAEFLSLRTTCVLQDILVQFMISAVNERQ